MKNYLIGLFVALSASAFAADQLRVSGSTTPDAVWQYGPYTGSWFSTYGTNDTTGYTNSLKAVRIDGGTSVSIGCKVAGYSANASNAITIKIWPSNDGVNKAGVTAANGTVTAAAATGWLIVPNGSTDVNVYTNLPLSSTTVAGPTAAPFLLFQVENPGSNPVALTNLIVTCTVKP